MRTCSKCGELKPLDLVHFQAEKRTASGLSYSCRVCKRRAEKLRRDNTLSEVFRGIKNRCENPNNVSYQWYGARGVKCLFKDWRELNKCVGSRPSPKHSIDRINNEGHYEPGNVRWATPLEQNKNKRKGSTSAKIRELEKQLAEARQEIDRLNEMVSLQARALNESVGHGLKLKQKLTAAQQKIKRLKAWKKN